MPEGLNQDQTTPVEQIVQQIAGQVEEPKAEALPDDVDARALAEAKAELAAEQEAAKASEGAPQVTAEPAKAGEPAKVEQPKTEGEKPKPVPGMVPLDRFKKVIDERNEKDRQLAYLAGQLSIIQKPADTKAEPTPEQQLEAIKAKRLEVATNLDDGKISNRQAEEERQTLQGQEDAIRAKLATPKVAETKPEPKGPDLYTESKLAELETQHPYTKELDNPKYAAHWDFLSKEATQALIADGTLKAGQKSLTPAQDLKFKSKMAELTDVYGPIWTGKQLQPAKTTEVKDEPKKAPTKIAQARAEKLTLQSEIAPDVSQLGSAGPAGPDHSDAAIEAMNEEDIIKTVPKSTRDRIMGRVPR